MKHRKDVNGPLETVMVEFESLSPAEYLEIINARPHMIESARIEPARLGKGTFGKLMVRYTRPFYKVAAQ